MSLKGDHYIFPCFLFVTMGYGHIKHGQSFKVLYEQRDYES